MYVKNKWKYGKKCLKSVCLVFVCFMLQTTTRCMLLHNSKDEKIDNVGIYKMHNKKNYLSSIRTMK